MYTNERSRPGRMASRGLLLVLCFAPAAFAQSNSALLPIDLQPTNLEFEAIRNGPCPFPLEFSISCSDDQSTCWYLADDAAWLEERQDNRTDVLVSVNCTNLTPGSYETDIFVSTDETGVLGKVHVRYTIISNETGSIAGTVHCLGHSNILPEATIMVYRDAVCVLATHSDADGAFLLRSLPAGIYSLNASTPGLMSRDVTVEVIANQTSACDLLLMPKLDGAAEYYPEALY